MPNITKLTENYILEHPSIKDCLKNGLINYSSLSRQIASDLNLNLKKNFDAILIACRRMKRKLKKEETFENKILKILKESKIEIKNKVIAVVLEKDIFFENLINLEKEIKKRKEIFRVIEGISAITIITAEDFIDLIKKYFKNKIMLENKNLAEITIKSPKEIETTPGTYAYLCSLFGENNINIIETLSCWTDTIFLVKEEDVGKVMGLLRF
ncbi:ACT domain-containing protein [Candidatus Woesearchaeota archaeon]|nr:ACT domain-containing protein [Candidatus Woesearchaeota archaeon]